MLHGKTFRYIAAFAAAFCANASLAFLPLFSDDVRLVSGGIINAEIILPQGAQKQEAAAANSMAQTLAKLADGGRISVAYNGFGRADSDVKIYFLRNPDAKKLSPKIADFSKTNIYKTAIGDGEIRLFYPLPQNAENAAGYFLTEFCGVRFFAPSEIGTEYGKFESLKIPAQTREFKPSFESFFMTAPRTENFMRLNGANRMLPWFSHNLSKIFDAETFKTNPELFGKKRNSRGELAPVFSGQPNILSAEAQRRAANKASDFFLNNPGRLIFSIGINDSAFYGDSPDIQKERRGYFRGYPDYSNAVFKFSNTVANAVAKKYPDKFIGCLAYLTCENTPDFKTAENLVPYVTTDRANYYDANFKSEDFELLERWGKSGAKIWGVYDYLYGSPFFIPRPIAEYACEGIKKAYAEGARAYYAEDYPIWAYDAQKIWTIMQVLNNVSKDPDALKREFFKSFYKDCAEDVEEFFAVAESAWTRRGGATRWLNLYKSESQADLLGKARLQKMDSLIESAKRKARASDDKILKRRIYEVSLAFDVTRSFCNEWFLKKEIFGAVHEKAPPEKIADMLANLDFARRLKIFYLENLKNNSVYPNSSLDFWKNDLSSPTDLAVLYVLSKIPEANLSADESSVKRALRYLHEKPKNLLPFGDFEVNADAHTLPLPETWAMEMRDYDGTAMRLSKDAAFEGGYGVEFKMSELSGFARNLPIADGKSISFEGMVKTDFSDGAICYATVVFIDGAGEILGRKTLVIPNAYKSEFGRFYLSADAPKGSKIVNVGFFASYLKKGDKVYLDNLEAKIF